MCLLVSACSSSFSHRPSRFPSSKVLFSPRHSDQIRLQLRSPRRLGPLSPTSHRRSDKLPRDGFFLSRVFLSLQQTLQLLGDSLSRHRVLLCLSNALFRVFRFSEKRDFGKGAGGDRGHQCVSATVQNSGRRDEVVWEHRLFFARS